MSKLFNRLKKIHILNVLLRFIYRKIKPDKGNIRYWIKKLMSNRKIQVVQIGSNDGVSGDTLNKFIKENKHKNFIK